MPRKTPLTPAELAAAKIIAEEARLGTVPMHWGESQESTGRDSRDFSEIAVWTLRDMLRDAYAAGFSACAEQIGGAK